MTECSKEYLEMRIAQLEKLLKAQRQADQQAVALARAALEHRLESMNEIREQLGSQKSEFMSRESGEFRIRMLETSLAKAQGALALVTIVLTVLSIAGIVVGLVR